MELRHLRYFVAVAEELHFGRAAQRLFVSQPPLSQQIKDLERDVGTTLLSRTQRRVELTDAGRIFLKDAKEILSRVDLAVRTAQRAANGHTGRLVVGYIPYAGIDVLPKAMETFGRRFPKVEVVLERMISGEQAKALREKRIDIGLLCPPFLDTGLDVKIILREPLILGLSQNHSLVRKRHIPLSSLNSQPVIFIRYIHGSGYPEQIATICRSAGVELEVREAHDESAIWPMVASGLGVCLLPASAHKIRHRGVVYRGLDDCPQQVELAVALRRDDSTAVVRNFVELIRNGGR